MLDVDQNDVGVGPTTSAWKQMARRERGEERVICDSLELMPLDERGGNPSEMSCSFEDFVEVFEFFWSE